MLSRIMPVSLPGCGSASATAPKWKKSAGSRGILQAGNRRWRLGYCGLDMKNGKGKRTKNRQVTSFRPRPSPGDRAGGFPGGMAWLLYQISIYSRNGQCYSLACIALHAPWRFSDRARFSGDDPPPAQAGEQPRRCIPLTVEDVSDLRSVFGRWTVQAVIP